MMKLPPPDSKIFTNDTYCSEYAIVFMTLAFYFCMRQNVPTEFLVSKNFPGVMQNPLWKGTQAPRAPGILRPPCINTPDNIACYRPAFNNRMCMINCFKHIKYAIHRITMTSFAITLSVADAML